MACTGARAVRGGHRRASCRAPGHDHRAIDALLEELYLEVVEFVFVHKECLFGHSGLPSLSVLISHVLIMYPSSGVPLPGECLQVLNVSFVGLA